MVEDQGDAEMEWMRAKMERMGKLTADYIEALARHHVDRNGDNRMALAGECFSIRQKLDAVMREEFQYNGSSQDVEKSVDYTGSLI